MDSVIFYRDKFTEQKSDGVASNVGKRYDKAVFKTYYNIRNSAWHFLIDNEKNALPLDLRAIAGRYKWTIFEYSDDKETIDTLFRGVRYEDYAGITMIQDGRVFIAYRHVDDKIDRFTIAHEFGHVSLRHFVHSMEYRKFEKEANMFAARILMPMCVIKECRAFTADNISALCGTSLQAAQFRAERLAMLLDRKKFYTSPLEIQVLDTFSGFLLERSLEQEKKDD